MYYLILFLKGIAMGMADIIPGVSGGTIAFITGIYEKLIASIKSFNWTALKFLLKGNIKGALHHIQWKFLLALITGIATAMISLAHFFSYLLNHSIYHSFLYAIFFGLIAGSIIFCFRQVRSWNIIVVVAFGVGIIAAFMLTSYKPSSKNNSYDVSLVYHSAEKFDNYNPDQQKLLSVSPEALSVLLAKGTITKTTPLFIHGTEKKISIENIISPHSYHIDWWIIFCGALAASAMLLPGISGSYILTILGAYPIVLGALADFSAKFDPAAGMTLASCAIGIIIGLVVFSRIINWLFAHYRNITIAMLTGFMIGALRSVWPFWSFSYQLNPFKTNLKPILKLTSPTTPSFNHSIFWICLGLAITSFAAVMILETISKKLACKNSRRSI